MQNKPKDISHKKVTFDNPIPKERLKLLYDYIVGRYSIHINKDILKLPKEQWYKDIADEEQKKVFMRYKFCNVRREHDRYTLWIIDNVLTKKDASLQDKIYRTILYRIYNSLFAAELIDLANIDFAHVNLKKIRKSIEDLNVRPSMMYGKAFRTVSMKTSLNRVYHDDLRIEPVLFVKDLWKEKFADKILACETAEEVTNVLKTKNGIGDFLSYQIFVDLTYIPEFPFSENEHVIAGPGCRFGLEIFYDTKELPPTDDLLFYLSDNLVELWKEQGLVFDPDKVFYDLLKRDRRINVMCLENCFCEYQKFYSILHGKHRRVYRGVDYDKKRFNEIKKDK